MKSREYKARFRVLALCDDADSTITKIRITIPLAAALGEIHGELRVTDFMSASSKDLVWADVVVIQRGATDAALKMAVICARSEKPLVYEVDDLLTDIPDFLSHHVGYIEGREKIIKMIGMAKIVSVSTQPLLEELSQYAGKLKTCPNYHINHQLARASHDERDEVNIIIASSDRIKVDFVAEALIHICRLYGDRVKVTAIGPIGEVLRDLGVKCEVRKIIPHENFIAEICAYVNPIGIIPLDASLFSACKSAVKYFDYGVSGVFVIASDVRPYNDVIESGVNGLLSSNNTEAWVDALRLSIDSLSLRRGIVENAKVSIEKNFSLEVTVKSWLELFDEFLKSDFAESRLMRADLIKKNYAEAWGFFSFKKFIKVKNQQRKKWWRKTKAKLFSH